MSFQVLGKRNEMYKVSPNEFNLTCVLLTHCALLRHHICMRDGNIRTNMNDIMWHQMQQLRMRQLLHKSLSLHMQSSTHDSSSWKNRTWVIWPWKTIWFWFFTFSVFQIYDFATASNLAVITIQFLKATFSPFCNCKYQRCLNFWHFECATYCNIPLATI